VAEPFIGQIVLVGFNFAPVGYALCDGQLQSIAQNSALFALLGTQFGGDGQSTFGLPDLRGRAPVHQGNGPGLTPRAIGERGGGETNTLTVAQMPAHSHPLNASSAAGNSASPSASTVLSASSFRGQQSFASGNATQTMATNSLSATGGGQPVSIMQPYRTVNYVIALEGIFPSRN
jgi:microcystin-dependent protein